jgi:cytochrome c oxidase cbb3-type subunit I/II
MINAEVTESGAFERSDGASVRSLKVTYDDVLPVRFAFASMIWGIVGMLVGALIALQLAWWPANIHPYLSFGRLRPLHTNAVIFAFVGNMVFAGIYHSSQRLLKTRLASDLLGRIHFWGWQAIIVSAALTLPLGYTQGKEYAELEWPIDLAITVIWVVFAVNFFWTVAKRNEKHLYVAIWFYIATIVTVAMLHLVNSLAIPVFALKSYSIFGGTQDALVQWWYGHNAVAFFLTTPVLGIVYSYRLSIVHFWSLIFLYIWAGPHHLLNTALPEWAQTLGMVFSIMLWAPSWGGMINGLFTIRAAWDKLRVDPVLKFFAAGITAYGMTTFEGPLLSIRSVSSLAHYTDWIIAHVHNGALGWNGFMAAGVFYYLIPAVYGKKLHSIKLANAHFYLGTAGIVLYVVSMWASGITQGLMLRALAKDGSLEYPNYVETLIAQMPLYWTRLVGGTLYLLGMMMMTYNLARTAYGSKVQTSTVQVVALTPAHKEPSWTTLVTASPIQLVVAVAVLIGLTLVTNMYAGTLFGILAFVVATLGMLALQSAQARGEGGWHRILEGRSLIFSVLTGIAVVIGGVAEFVPAVLGTPKDAMLGAQPYTALELEGRDIYLREGCYNCHSQMIRPLFFETQRYGEPSEMRDSVFDHPFQWGSKRTGPDLARVGGKYPHAWHYAHMKDPRQISPGSNMPSYAHLETARVDFTRTVAKVSAMKSIGVPYSPGQVLAAPEMAQKQGELVASALAKDGIKTPTDTELVALIAYLQRLGKTPPPQAEAPISRTP